MWCIIRNNIQQSHLWVRVQFFSPACSKATIIDCSIRSLSMKPRKSSRYTVRSGSWKVQRGVSRSGSLLVPPVFETWERAKDTIVELAWEMPLDRRFSVAAQRQWWKMWRNVVISGVLLNSFFVVIQKTSNLEEIWRRKKKKHIPMGSSDAST